MSVIGCLLVANQVAAQSADCEGGFNLVEGEDYECGYGGCIDPETEEFLASSEEELIALYSEETDESCTADNPSTEVIRNELQRLYMTDFLFRFSGVIQNRFFGRSGGGPNVGSNNNNNVAGRSAGDTFANWSPWLSYARTSSENNLSSTAYDGTQDSFLLGADYTFSERLVAGLAVGYENNEVTTAFNGGSLDNKGYTFAPYIAYLLTDTISIDGTVGYSNLSIDQTRINFGGGGNVILADTDADRWFVASNLNTFHRYRDLSLLGRVGIIYSEDDQDGYAERGAGGQAVASNKSEFGQLQIGGEVAYSVHAIEPFASVYYEYDYESETPQVAAGQAAPSRDDDDFRISAGFRYFGNSGFTGALEYSGIAGREDYDSHSISLIGRMQF